MSDFPYRMGYRMGLISMREHIEKGRDIPTNDDEVKELASRLVFVPNDDEASGWKEHEIKEFKEGFVDGVIDEWKKFINEVVDRR